MRRSSFLLIVSALFLTSVPLQAADLGKAKANGQVCEQTNGFLRAKSGAPGDVKSMVNNINAQRKAEYERIAKKNNVSREQVGKLTAEKVINKAPQHKC